jgi:hypothetical protein
MTNDLISMVDEQIYPIWRSVLQDFATPFGA